MSVVFCAYQRNGVPRRASFLYHLVILQPSSSHSSSCPCATLFLVLFSPPRQWHKFNSSLCNREMSLPSRDWCSLARPEWTIIRDNSSAGTKVPSLSKQPLVHFYEARTTEEVVLSVLAPFGANDPGCGPLATYACTFLGLKSFTRRVLNSRPPGHTLHLIACLTTKRV